MIAQAQHGVDADLAVRRKLGFDRGVRHEPRANEGVRGVLHIVRTVDRGSGRPPRGSVLKRRRLRAAATGRSLAMHARRELLNPTSSNTEAQLELRGKKKLRAQRQEESVLKRVGNRLELVPHRRVRSLQQRQPLTGSLQGRFKDSLSVCTIGQRTRTHDVSNDGVSQSHNTTLFLVFDPPQALSRRRPADSTASHDTPRQTYLNHDVNSIAT